jgi:hypothetical protein
MGVAVRTGGPMTQPGAFGWASPPRLIFSRSFQRSSSLIAELWGPIFMGFLDFAGHFGTALFYNTMTTNAFMASVLCRFVL